MDFLVSDLASYWHVRNLVREQGVQALMKSANTCQFQTLDICRDQYEILTEVFVKWKPTKFEIVLDKRLFSVL